MTIMLERPAAAEAPAAEPARRRRPPRRRAPQPSCAPVLAGGWMDSAACRHEEPELFFDPARRAEAKAVCASCPVREACLRSAMAEERPPLGQSPAQNRKTRFGVRGGLAAGERWAMVHPGMEDPGEAE